MVYEDPAESGYADFKLMAAAFRVWVRHASALRALRVAREAEARLRVSEAAGLAP